MSTTMTANKSLRTVLYGRLSSERQAKLSKSVDDQLSSLRSWADHEGHTVVATLRDDGISASRYARKKARPDWQRAMELIMAGMVDALAVWAIPRASRDRMTYAMLMNACIENDVLIAVDGKLHDPADPDDSLNLDLQSLLAVNTSARISKDARRSVEARAARGAPHGRVPDGYVIEYDPATGKPLRRVIDPIRGPLFREMVNRLLAGESAYSIANDLNERGIKTRSGGIWYGANIINRVRKPSMAGLRTHHGHVLPDVTAEWPPLITVEEHHRLQALLSDPTRKSNKEGRTLKHLGTGVYVCGVCGGKIGMLSGYKKPSMEHWKKYRCRDRRCVSRGVEETDTKVEMAIVEYLSRPDIFLLLAETSKDAEVALAQAEAARLRAELADALVLVKSSKLSVASFAVIEQGLSARLEDAEQRSRPKHLPTVVYDVAGPEAYDRWEATPVPGKRAIIRALVDVKIMPTGPRNRNTPFDPSKIVVTPKAS